MVASLAARLYWQAACLVSGPDELSGAGIAAGPAVAGGAVHDHTRWAHTTAAYPESLPVRGDPGLPLSAAQGCMVPITAR